MKEKEGYVDCPEQQVIIYVEKENGTYGPIQTGSYITKNYIDDYFLKRKNLEASLQEQVKRDEISPVKFFMVFEDLTLSELSARTKIPTRKVRKHLLPVHFNKISDDLLNRYAIVFNISVDQLININPGPELTNAEVDNK
ncbi:MAG: hypothetical protein ISR57_02685 [Bacteroidales bacterium]|nr:hypothetical protein [Bacteroidota bacterium]MBL6949527.1 hypothetical protein [Bacteroidales bacterium]